MPRAAWKQSSADSARLPPAPGPLLPAAIRPLATVLLAACVAIIVLLGALFQHQTQADWLDRAVDARLRASLGRHQVVLNLVAQLGVGRSVAVAAVVLVLACLAMRRWRGALLVAVALPAAGALTEFLLKPLIGRTRLGMLSFPSGHATGAFSVAAAFAVLLIDPVRPRMPAALRMILAVIAFLVAVAVAVAATALGLHYFTDTVGGAAVGTGTVLVTALIIDRIGSWHSRTGSRHRWSRQRRSPDTPPDSRALAGGSVAILQPDQALEDVPEDLIAIWPSGGRPGRGRWGHASSRDAARCAHAGQGGQGHPARGAEL